MATCISSLDLNFKAPVEVRKLERYRDILRLPKHKQFSIQGSGLSIAACSMDSDVPALNMKRFDKLLSVSLSEGFVEAEAGITLDKLNQFLLPKGYIVPVQPGYPQITLGGCIAGNVHGKNHYKDGSFSRHVISLALFHPQHSEIIHLSEQSESELFKLTCGGFGLTGIILSAKIRIQPVRGNCVNLSHSPALSLSDTVSKLLSLKDKHDFLYSWHDLSRFDSKMGIGYVVYGDFVQRLTPPKERKGWYALDTARKRVQIPLLNNASLPFINRMYYYLTKNSHNTILSINNAIFPWITKAWYFGCFGQQGLLELQMLVSEQHISAFLSEFEAILRKYRQPFAIASLKLFKGEQSLLHYDGSGISFSIQMPNCDNAMALMDDMDQLNIKYQAIMNLIKDSRLNRHTTMQLYPEFSKFEQQLHHYDPNRQFVSQLSKRIGL